jgi:hypothetical protein
MMIKKQSLLSANLILLFMMLVIIPLASCERNRCKTRGIECQNEGVCNDGNCLCPAEFEGDSCQIATNKKFAGRFEGLFVTVGGVTPSSDTITVSQIAGKNLGIAWTHDKIKNATIIGSVKSNDIVVPAMLGANGYTYQGSGSLNKDIITLTMRADSLVGGSSFKSYVYTFAGNRIN